jgi:hypothetical protein
MERFAIGRRWVVALALLALVATVVAVLATRGGHELGMDEVRYTDGKSRELPPVAAGAKKLAAGSAELRKELARGSTGGARVRTLHGRIQAATRELTDQFGRDRRRLRQLGADGALDRLGTLEERTEKALAALDDALDHKSASAARRALDRLSAEPDPPALSTELPLRSDNAHPGAPSLGAAIAPAYQAPTGSVEPSSLPREPSDDDRAAAPEGDTGGTVDAQASALGDDPIRIYEWVRNEIGFEPYLGIRKGAAGTLYERSGNDADQAALLVALLRAADVPARYVHGTARLPIDQAANWLGLDTGAGDKASVAPDLLASAGIPARAIAYGDTIRYVDFDHVWVEAHVPQAAYRGVEENAGSRTWAPLDPSIKTNRFVRPVDMSDVIEPLGTELQDEIAGGIEHAGDDSVTLTPPSELRASFESAIGDAAAAFRQRAGDQITIGKAVGSHSVEHEELGYLPASLPFVEREVDAEWRAVPEELVATVSVQLAGADFDPSRAARSDAEPSISYSAETWKLFGKRLTLGYAPATEGDAEVIDAYHGLLSTPAYAAELIPVLRLDGNVVGRGGRATVGWFQGLAVTFDEPGQRAATVRNPAQVGAISAIVVDPASVSPARVRANAARLSELGPETTEANAMTDARAGTLLSAAGDLYFARNDGMNRMLARAGGVQQQRQLSGALTATALATDYVVGFPVAIGFAGLSIDVDQDMQSIVSNDGDDDRVEAYLAQSGLHASYSEGRGFEGALSGRPASTAHVFQQAAEQGIPLHVVAPSNIEQSLATVDAPSSAEAEIRNAVSLGQLVTIPRSPVRIGGFHGTAYTIEDLDSGAAAFRLSNGTNGGSLIRAIDQQFEENITAMLMNIGMLKGWVAQSGNGMFVQGNEVFAPSAPDGEYCDVFVDPQGAAIALMAILIAKAAIDQPKDAKGSAKALLDSFFGQYYLPENMRVDLVKTANIALLYTMLYTESRMIALNCLPLG